MMKTIASKLFWAGFLFLTCLLLPAGRVSGEDHSWVRGAPEAADLKGGFQGVVLKVSVVDSTLPATLAAPGYAAVDVVMNQCFSGGFLSYLKGTPPATDWTFSSAANIKESSWYLAGIVPPATQGISDNYTRAWRDDALVNPATGMKQHYMTALSGKGNIPKDRFSPPGSVANYIVIPLKVTQIHAVPQFKTVTRGNPPKKMQVPNGVKYVPMTSTVKATYPVVEGAFIGKNGWWVFCPPPGSASGTAGQWFQATPVGPEGAPTSWMITVNKTAMTFPNWIKVGQGLEHPQYGSAGAGSDARTINPDPANVQQYAILVQWDMPVFWNGPNKNAVPTADFAASISRMYNMLTGAPNNLSPKNIAVLYFTGLYDDGTTGLPEFKLTPGPMGAKNETLPALPGIINGPTGVDGDGNQEFADDAVPGKLFPGGVPANFKTSDLLVYFVGHGGRDSTHVKVGLATDPGLLLTLSPDAQTNDDGSVTLQGFDGAGEYEQALATYLATTNNPDISTEESIFDYTTNFLDGFQGPMDLIQISTTELIPDGVELIINGYTNTIPLEPVMDTNEVVLDLDPIVPGLLTNTYTYQILVDNGLFYNSTTNSTNPPSPIQLWFQGFPATNFSPNFVAAVIIAGATSEVAYVTPDFTAGTNSLNLVAEDFDGGMLLSWPPGATNYYILQNCDLSTTNWTPVCIPNTTIPEITGIADQNLPMGTNWAFITYTNTQMFFELQPVPPP